MKADPPESTDDSIALREYESLTGLFKFYLDLVFKTFTFTLVACGAVAAFVIEKGDSAGPHAKYALLIPALLATSIAIAFFRGLGPAKELDDTLQKHGETLKMALPPHAANLVGALSLFGTVLAVVAVGLFAACSRWDKLKPQTDKQSSQSAHEAPAAKTSK